MSASRVNLLSACDNSNYFCVIFIEFIVSVSFNGCALLELITLQFTTFKDIHYNYSPSFELDTALSFVQ